MGGITVRGQPVADLVPVETRPLAVVPTAAVLAALRPLASPELRAELEADADQVGYLDEL